MEVFLSSFATWAQDLDRIESHLFTSLISNLENAIKVSYIEDITRWREDMNFMFEWQEQYLTSEILFLPREHKIHIFEPTCNVLFIIWRQNIQQKQKAGIVTSLNDTTLTKVT